MEVIKLDRSFPLLPPSWTATSSFHGEADLCPLLRVSTSLLPPTSDSATDTCDPAGGTGRLRCFWGFYLGLVPVEADAPVVSERSHVALELGEVGPLVQDLLRLGLVSRHHVDHFAHGVGQQLPDLQTDRQTRCQYLLLRPLDRLSRFIPELEDI